MTQTDPKRPSQFPDSRQSAKTRFCELKCLEAAVDDLTVLWCSAPEDILLQWVSAMPETRAPLVAREINICSAKNNGEVAPALNSDEKSPVGLSSLAARLLDLSPDKAAVLLGFSKHFNPSGWSGSLAQTLAPYLALVEDLAGHADSVVATWAQEALQAMQRRIQHDRTMDVLREQSFE